MQIGRRAMGALSVRYGTQYTSGNIAEAICKYSIIVSSKDNVLYLHGNDYCDIT